MKPVLVTGATGFLGKHLVSRLKGETPLRVLCRGSSPWDGDPQVEIVHGDINCPDHVSRAVEGAGQIYHLAGMVSRDPADAEMLYRVHVDGTRNLCDAALKHSSEKVVMVSSSGTIAVSHAPILHTEKSGYKNHVVGRWAYYLSKIFAEKLVFSYVRRHGLPAVVVSPALLLGPGDDRGSSVSDVVMFLKGRILALPMGGMSFVDARDVADGLIAAMRAGRTGERYLTGGSNWTFGEVMQRLSGLTGVAAPKLQPGLKTSLWSARVLRQFSKSLQGLDDVSIEMSALYWYCDSSKATRELGFKSRDPMQTLADTVEDIRRAKPR